MKFKKRYILRILLAMLCVCIIAVAGVAMKQYYRLEIKQLRSIGRRVARV